MEGLSRESAQATEAAEAITFLSQTEYYIFTTVSTTAAERCPEAGCSDKTLETNLTS